jgi:hypothetical protein
VGKILDCALLLGREELKRQLRTIVACLANERTTFLNDGMPVNLTLYYVFV